MRDARMTDDQLRQRALTREGWRRGESSRFSVACSECGRRLIDFGFLNGKTLDDVASERAAMDAPGSNWDNMGYLEVLRHKTPAAEARVVAGDFFGDVTFTGSAVTNPDGSPAADDVRWTLRCNPKPSKCGRGPVVLREKRFLRQALPLLQRRMSTVYVTADGTVRPHQEIGTGWSVESAGRGAPASPSVLAREA